eukprot:TRINITY_DN6140_c0_g1_i1.p1 TRINITY_DN6140_c0_g1~~TRINITY_DN6140_c0_g1_i1.p1  ORF type:complete len:625 (+),score=156.91 TRINITY_DN6140_c0_g1_i1:177-2051(+)
MSGTGNNAFWHQDAQGYDRAHTPVHRRPTPGEALVATPTARTSASEVSPSLYDVKMACPQPVSGKFRGFPASPAPCGTPLWSNADDKHEKVEDFSKAMEGLPVPFMDTFMEMRPLSSMSADASKITIDGRPLSSLSTAAGMTPAPDAESLGLPPHAMVAPGYCTNQAEGCPPWFFSSHPVVDPTVAVSTPSSEDGKQTPPMHVADEGMLPEAPRSPPPLADRGSHDGGNGQLKKVFVGGVPQDIHDLYKVFEQFGNIKKAWLQKCHTKGPNGGAGTAAMQNHRGFGFVIFQDVATADKLLGPGNFSRFLVLPDGRKLEVKRALTSHLLQDKAPPNASAGNVSTGIAPLQQHGAQRQNAQRLQQQASGHQRSSQQPLQQHPAKSQQAAPARPMQQAAHVPLAAVAAGLPMGTPLPQGVMWQPNMQQQQGMPQAVPNWAYAAPPGSYQMPGQVAQMTSMPPGQFMAPRGCFPANVPMMMSAPASNLQQHQVAAAGGMQTQPAIQADAEADLNKTSPQQPSQALLARAGSPPQHQLQPQLQQPQPQLQQPQPQLPQQSQQSGASQPPAQAVGWPPMGRQEVNRSANQSPAMPYMMESGGVLPWNHDFQDPRETEKMLKNAMPDHYDD